MLTSGLVMGQFDDDEIGETETEMVCNPAEMLTKYDSTDYGEIDLNSVRQWYSFGSEYYKNKNYKSALPYLWKVFITDSTKYGRNAIRKIADSYFKLQQADSTFIACYRGLARYPDHMTLHYFAGFLQDNVGKPACAIPHYEALVADNPKKEEYLEKLAFLYYKVEDKRAMDVQQQLVTLAPTNSEYANTLAQYSDYFLGAGGGLAAYKQAWENDPENLDFAFKYGKAAYEAGEYKNALIPLQKVVAKDPKNNEAHNIIALCDESLERYSAAIAEYKKVLETEPGNAEAMCAIATDYRYLNQFSNGLYWVNRALQVKSGFGMAYIVLAEIYESAVTYCQNKDNRKRKYDDGLVYEKALSAYKKAARDPNFKAQANRGIRNLQPYLPTDEEKFMNQNRKQLKEKCYTSWIK
jgi:tetratricopeptide (TPR) repeat protein